jgi:Uma2 family endonuclease
MGPYRRKDYEALPEEPRCELIRGRFCLSPSPATLHQILLVLLAERFSALAEAAGGLVLIAPMDVALADHTVLQPDLLYLSVSRCERAALAAGVQGAPDLVVEILSPGTAARDRGVKLELYAEAGVREYWIVDTGRLGRPLRSRSAQGSRSSADSRGLAPSIDFLVQVGTGEDRTGGRGAAGRFVAQAPGGAWYQSPALAEVRLDIADFWRRAGELAARAAATGSRGR